MPVITSFNVHDVSRLDLVDEHAGDTHWIRAKLYSSDGYCLELTIFQSEPGQFKDNFADYITAVEEAAKPQEPPAPEYEYEDRLADPQDPLPSDHDDDPLLD